MRIFKDLDLVEQLGSEIPRILQAYAKDSFHFSENFLRVTLPSTESVTQTQQVKELLKVFKGTHSRGELQEMLGLSDRESFRQKYLQPAIEAGLIALTIPDKPTSRNQKYYLTEKGKTTHKSLE